MKYSSSTQNSTCHNIHHLFLLLIGCLFILLLACSTAAEADKQDAEGQQAICGNGICEDGETASNCPSDCGEFDSNAHFDFERAKPGVVAAVSWRNQSEIDADEYGGNSPGDPAYPTYDATIDAARLGIIDGQNLSQLRHAFPFVNGSVWTQHEIMLDPVLLTNTFDGLGMKLWRWRDDTKTECNDERRLTTNIGYGPDALVYHRDGCPLPEGEVRVMTPQNVLDFQPGGETQCLYRRDEPHPDCFRWAPGVWLRLTYHFDFGGRTLHIWARRMDEDVPRKIVEFSVPDWNSNYGFDLCGIWLHSTSRTHGEWPSGLPDAYIWARNMIISTQPITP